MYLAGVRQLLILSKRMRRNLRKLVQFVDIIDCQLLCSHEAVNDKVDRAVEDEEEVLDGCEAKHPTWVGRKHSQRPA